MTSVNRPIRRRCLNGHAVETLEWRGLLSNLPTISAAIPAAGPSTGNVSDGRTTAASVSYGDAWPADETVDSGDDDPTDSDDVQLTTQPANSSVSSVGPTQLVISFSQPGNAFDLGFNDIRLDQVNSDGTTTPVFDPSNLPQEIADDDDGMDPTFTQLTIPLSSSLPAGTYQIVLVGGTLISSDVADGRWDPSSDYIIATFTVGDPTPPTPPNPVLVSYSTLQPDAAVQSLTDLGPIGATPVSQTGLLTPIPGTPSVQLYQFTLPAGHHWSLSLSANPQGVAGQLQTTLSLYEVDANGNLVPVSLGAGESGLSISPTAPDTFAGVDSGTFCLAVSGIYTASGANASGGVFQLGISATIADQAVSVTGSQLNWANINDSSPAGLTIEFSGPIALSGFGESDEATPPLEVVDTQGRVWDVLPVGYQDQGNILTLAFEDPLPAGTYFLKVGTVNGLTDLAGWTPVAGGFAAGILASWSVAADQTAPPESYLGVVWPGSGEVIGRSIEVPDGTTTYSQFVVTVPGFYSLQAIVGGGSAEAQIFSEYGTIYLDAQTTSSFSSFQVYLPVGDYVLAWTGQSTAPCQINWTLAAAPTGPESLLDNGVGQWSSLNLGFGSNPGTPTTTSYLPNNGVWQGPMQYPGYSNLTVQTGTVAAQTPSASASASNGLVAPIATLNALELTLTPTVYGIAGLAPILSLNVSSVGPSVASGATSVSHGSAALPGGIRYRSMKRGLGLGVEESPIEESEILATSGQSTGESAAVAVAPATKDDPITTDESLSQDADRRALASTEWVTTIGQMVQNWFGTPSASRTELPGAEIDIRDIASLPATQLAELASYRNKRPEVVEEGVERASFGLPLGVILATAVVCRSKGPILRWWKEERRRLSKPTFPGKRKALDGPTDEESEGQDFQVRIIRRPHFMSRRCRGETQAHASAYRGTGRNPWK